MTSLLLNWVLTSTLLIAFVLLLRATFGKHIRAWLQYALWAVVLIRLLVPVQLFTAPIETPQVQVALPVQTMPESPAPGNGVPVSSEPEARKTLDYLTLLGGVWLGGTAVAMLALLWCNLCFVRRLRRVRVPLAETDCSLKVYITEGLPSSCLFGNIRPAVYLTPEVAADPTMLRHVLVHEATHFRHGDHIWSVLRCVALAIHWWNPLVWLATVLSRQDAELACDEGALKRLGDHERSAYGGTLLTLVTSKPQPSDMLCCATTMTGTKRSLRERVRRIAHTPKRWFWAMVLTVVLSALMSVCAFTKTTQWYNAEDYRLNIPNGFHVSVDGETVLLYRAEEPVGGVTHYIESMTYDDLIILLQKGEEWESYSLETDHFSDKLLSFVNVDGEEYHHYIYRSLNDGIYDLWLNSGKISDAVETKIVEQFKLVY